MTTLVVPTLRAVASQYWTQVLCAVPTQVKTRLDSLEAAVLVSDQYQRLATRRQNQNPAVLDYRRCRLMDSYPRHQTHLDLPVPARSPY